MAAVAAWYALAYQRDWFYFYFRAGAVVRDTAAFAQELHDTRVPMQSLGLVEYGSKRLPLWVLRQPASPPALVKTAGPPAPVVCLMGSIHGNEPAGAQALLALAQDMQKRPQDFAGIRWVMVPVANPWGWARDLRHNGDNHDAARMFAAGQSQESELLKQLFAAEHCAVLIDLHEDRLHPGFYALAYGDPKPLQVDAAMQAVAGETGFALATRPAHGVWHVAESDFAGVRLTTASLWARQHGVPRAYVVETHDGMPLPDRVRIHRAAIAQLAAVATMATTPP